jgi:oligopeptide transport system substrate-binding protein
LAIAIDRERISRDDLDGATEPARKFLPEAMSTSDKPVVDKSELLDQDAHRAKELLAEAGFPDGEGFPTVHLLINRNDQQRIVAQSVAAMWRSVLNIETEITTKNWDEYEALVQSGDYNVVRRGIVMQTTDEFTNLRMMFRQDNRAATGTGNDQAAGRSQKNGKGKSAPVSAAKGEGPIESEAQALSQIRAMPIYFATSYSLVRPYVSGFDANVLDVPSLKNVKIETNWHEPKTASLFNR